MSEHKKSDMNHEAWARNAIAFIREKGMEREFQHWCWGWPCPAHDATRPETLAQSVSRLVVASHNAAIDAGWWTDLHTGESLIGKRNVGEMLMLAVSEIAEAMEGHRKGLQDEKLPHRPMMEVEMADCLIRLGDLAGSMDYDLGGAVAEKLEYNARRADHKPENRRKEGGKAY